MIKDWLQKVRDHAAVASGDFERLFKNTDSLSPLPTHTMKLVQEVNREEPDFERLQYLLNATPEIAAHILRISNSAFTGIRTEITDVKHAITMLGLRRIRQLVTSVSVMNSLPKPKSYLFNREGFWTDSLLNALLARGFCRHRFPEASEEVFTCTLLSEMAIPVLLVDWAEYYESVLEELQEGDQRLSEIERAQFGWDHGQAGAWLAQQWTFPREMVSFIGVHSLPADRLQAQELDQTPAGVIAVATHFPSILKNSEPGLQAEVSRALPLLGLSGEVLSNEIVQLQEEYNTLRQLLSLPEMEVPGRLEALREVFEQHQE